MGIFINYNSNIFKNLANIPQVIINATENVSWVTSLIICNKGAQPMRFNLQKFRKTGDTLELPCLVASIVGLDATYDNGLYDDGLGATLTNAGSLSLFTLDGVSPPLNSRILIKDQSNFYENGIYDVTTLGDNVSIPWLLTRSFDYETPTQIHQGDIINILNGNINANTQWQQTEIIENIGIDSIIFTLNTTNSIFYINELQITPYSTVDIIDITGTLNIVFSRTPFIQDQLICFSNGYTQTFDCEV